MDTFAIPLPSTYRFIQNEFHCAFLIRTRPEREREREREIVDYIIQKNPLDANKFIIISLSIRCQFVAGREKFQNRDPSSRQLSTILCQYFHRSLLKTRANSLVTSVVNWKRFSIRNLWSQLLKLFLLLKIPREFLWPVVQFPRDTRIQRNKIPDAATDRRVEAVWRTAVGN